MPLRAAIARRLDPARHAELAEDVRDVDAGRALADEQRLADLAVRAAARRAGQDLELARASARTAVGAVAPRGRSPLAGGSPRPEPGADSRAGRSAPAVSHRSLAAARPRGRARSRASPSAFARVAREPRARGSPRPPRSGRSRPGTGSRSAARLERGGPALRIRFGRDARGLGLGDRREPERRGPKAVHRARRWVGADRRVGEPRPRPCWIASTARASGRGPGASIARSRLGTQREPRGSRRGTASDVLCVGHPLDGLVDEAARVVEPAPRERSSIRPVDSGPLNWASWRPCDRLVRPTRSSRRPSSSRPVRIASGPATTAWLRRADALVLGLARRRSRSSPAPRPTDRGRSAPTRRSPRGTRPAAPHPDAAGPIRRPRAPPRRPPRRSTARPGGPSIGSSRRDGGRGRGRSPASSPANAARRSDAALVSRRAPTSATPRRAERVCLDVAAPTSRAISDRLLGVRDRPSVNWSLSIRSRRARR